MTSGKTVFSLYINSVSFKSRFQLLLILSIVDKINNNWKRLLKETEWMYKLNTVLPDGMNTKLLY